MPLSVYLISRGREKFSFGLDPCGQSGALFGYPARTTWPVSLKLILSIRTIRSEYSAVFFSINEFQENKKTLKISISSRVWGLNVLVIPDPFKLFVKLCDFTSRSFSGRRFLIGRFDVSSYSRVFGHTFGRIDNSFRARFT